MHHIGKEIFYTDVKHKLDSLSEKDYVVYFEGVRLGPVKDTMQKDTIYRKSRKITGVDFFTALSNKGYIDTIKNTLLGKKTKYISKYKLINQPRSLIPTSDTLRFKPLDANFVQLIAACENKYGVIMLDKYDYETNFGEKYKFKKNRELYEYFLTGFRNILISDKILNDSNKKIILLYGTKHFDGILENLKVADKNYKEVEKL